MWCLVSRQRVLQSRYLSAWSKTAGLHTLRHTTQKMQSRLKSLLRGKRPHVCFLGLSCKPLKGDLQIIRWDCRRCCVRLATWGKIHKNKLKDLSSMLNSSNRANLQLLYHTAELFPIFALQRKHSASIMAESKTPGPWTSACGSRSCSTSTFLSPHLMKNNTFSVAFPLRTLSG